MSCLPYICLVRVVDRQTGCANFSQETDTTDSSDNNEMQAHSGQPRSHTERAIMKLSAGFLPHSNPLLAEDIKNIVRDIFETRLRRFHLACPQSATAIMIPDPCNVLKEGEVFCSFSEAYVEESTGLLTDVIVGDICLVSRDSLLHPSVHLPNVLGTVSASLPAPIGYPEA